VAASPGVASQPSKVKLLAKMIEVNPLASPNTPPALARVHV
jgi:hypothetical protein